MAAVAAVLQGCGGPKSSSTSGADGEPMPTSSMAIDLRVESTEPGKAVVRANINDGKTFSTSYRLDGGDFLRACANGVCRNMADNDSVYTPDYIARFDFQPGVDYVVSFGRLKGGNAPDSRAVLPPSFTVVTPANHQMVSDGDTVVVSWSPTGAPARAWLDYNADCTFAGGTHSYSSGNLGSDTDADGSETVRIDPIVSFAQSNIAAAISRCSIDVNVHHELQGRVDPAFRKGSAIGIVTRKVNLDYLPR